MTLEMVDGGWIDDLGPGNGFMVTQGRVWVHALFASREAAVMAIRTPWPRLQLMRQVINNEANRKITVDDFKKELSNG